MSQTTHKEYMEMCSEVEFCNIHTETRIAVEDGEWKEDENGNEVGTVVQYCPECLDQKIEAQYQQYVFRNPKDIYEMEKENERDFYTVYDVPAFKKEFGNENPLNMPNREKLGLKEYLRDVCIEHNSSYNRPAMYPVIKRENEEKDDMWA